MASAKREHKIIMTDRLGDPIRLWWDHHNGGVCELEIVEGGRPAALAFNARELVELGSRLVAEGAAQLDDPAGLEHVDDDDRWFVTDGAGWRSSRAPVSRVEADRIAGGAA